MSESSNELRPRGRRRATPAASDAQPSPAPAEPQAVAVAVDPGAQLRPRDAARVARQGAAAVAAVPNETWASVLAAPVAAKSSAAKSPAEKNYASRAAAARGRRRSAAAAPKASALRSAKTAQRGGMVLAAAGLALAVVVPSAASSMNAAVPSAAVAPSSFGQVSADAAAEVSFGQASTTSTPNPDSKLLQVLSASAGNVTSAAAKGTLSAPLASMTVVSPFGYRVSPLTGASGELHTGQDLVAACSTQAYAAAGGTVTFASWDPYGGGNRVVIDHGNGLSTTYNHNSSLQVTVGQKVNRGDVVSLTGTTGNSTGCHLHFEVMVNNKTVDPQNWL